MLIGCSPPDFPFSNKISGSFSSKDLQIPGKEENPVSETLVIEYPCSDSTESDQTLDGSAKIDANCEKIDDSQCSKTLPELALEDDKRLEDAVLVEALDVKEGGEKLEVAQLSEALNESVKEGVEKLEDTQISETLDESVKEGVEKLEDTQIPEAVDESVKEGGEKLEDAQISKALDESVKEEGGDKENPQISGALDESVKESGKDIEDAEYFKIVGELEDTEDLVNLEELIGFDDNGEGGLSPDKKDLGFYPPVFGPYQPHDRQYGQMIEFGAPNQNQNQCMRSCCMKDNGVDEEDEEEEEDPYRRNRGMMWPMRGSYRRMGMSYRDHHHRRHCRRRNHRYCARDREPEMYGPRPSCNMERDSERFRYGEFPEPEPCSVGAGLANLGNTCFLNAIMQCFTHTVPLVQGLLSLKHEPSSHGMGEFCVLCAVRDQVEFSLGYSGRVVSPSYLVDNLSQISSFFQRYQQEDAHEFLQCLLDRLDSNWSRYEASANNLSAPGSSPPLSSSFDDTLVRQIFGGRLVSQIRCCNCGHNSDTYEPLIDLSLEIEDVDSLESALHSFTKVESIEDTEKFTCDGCKEQVKLEKQLILDQAPSVAALHLKRFKSDGVMVEKIDKKVVFPLELDLGPYTKGSNNENEDLKYELFAVVVHVGFSSTSGHYFCYIRTEPEKWYRFDDSKVTMVSEETVLLQDAYILFYARKDTPWFGSLIDKWKVECHQKISSFSPKSVLDHMDLPSTSYSAGTGLHGVEVDEKRDAIGDTCTAAPTTSMNEQLRKDEVETKAGVGTRPHGWNPFEADGPRGITGNASVTPATELMQDEVYTKTVNTQDTVVQFSAASSMPYNVEVKDEKFELDVLSLMDEDDASEYKTPSKVGGIEQTNGGAGTSSQLESIFGVEPTDDTDIKPSTPVRAPSPDIYSDEEPAEEAYRIPRDHLKIEDKSASTKKFINKENLDIKRKEAVKCVKSMPSSSRRQSLLAAINGPCSDSSLNKKRKHQLFHDKRSPKKRVKKVSPTSVSRPVTA